MLLTHYHHQADAPFQNLSALSNKDALSAIARLSQRTGAVYRRFRNPAQYLEQRRETEDWLRSEFIRKGGQPISRYPHYCVVEQSVWIEEGYNGQSGKVQVSLDACCLDQISFTYPDSMVSYWLRSQRDQVFYRPEYHGQVFVLSEIANIIEQVGIPTEEWRTEASRKYDLFIEAQVWADISWLTSA